MFLCLDINDKQGNLFCLILAAMFEFFRSIFFAAVWWRIGILATLIFPKKYYKYFVQTGRKILSSQATAYHFANCQPRIRAFIPNAGLGGKNSLIVASLCSFRQFSFLLVFRSFRTSFQLKGA